MLEGKNHKSVGLIFPVFARFKDKCTGRVEEARSTKVHVLYFELMMGAAKHDEKER